MVDGRWSSRAVAAGVDRGCVPTSAPSATALSVLACAAIVLTSCGRDPVKDAIRRLDGGQAQSRQAQMELRLTSQDPVPELMKTIENPRAKRRVRLQSLEVLGDIAKRQNSEEAFDFLVRILDSDDPAFVEAAVKGFVGAHHEKAVPALIRHKQKADKELLRLIDEALTSTAEYLVMEVEKLWNSPEAAMAEYKRVEDLGLDRGAMGYSKGKFLEARGQSDEAGKKFDELGLVRRWWVIGPFPNRQGMGFRKVYPPEREIDLETEYVAGYGKAAWYEIDHKLPAGLLNFEHYFVEVDNVVGYALVFLISDKERPVEVRAGSDDTITIFLNGETVWSHEQYRGVKYDDDVVDVTLREGPNALLMKVCEDWGGWALIGRVSGPGDTPLEGVEITLEPPDNIPWDRDG